MQKWISVLSQCPIFKSLPENEILNFFSSIPYSINNYPKDDLIYRTGDTASRIGIILSGHLEIRKCLSSGNFISLFHRTKGEVLGGSIVFSSRPQYPCDVVTKEDSFILWIEKDAALNAFLKNPVIAANIIRISANRIMQLENRVELFTFYSIQKKIAFSLLNDFTIDNDRSVLIPFSKTTWAEYLNVSRTSLSRELKNLCDAGMIKVDGRRITILQMDMLEAVLY